MVPHWSVKSLATTGVSIVGPAVSEINDDNCRTLTEPEPILKDAAFLVVQVNRLDRFTKDFCGIVVRVLHDVPLALAKTIQK